MPSITAQAQSQELQAPHPQRIASQCVRGTYAPFIIVIPKTRLEQKARGTLSQRASRNSLDVDMCVSLILGFRGLVQSCTD
jgi:hypothetical protein